MTKEEFIKGYCERSNITYERLRELGRSAQPCGPELGCDYEDCEGWQMAYVNDGLIFEQG